MCTGRETVEGWARECTGKHARIFFFWGGGSIIINYSHPGNHDKSCQMTAQLTLLYPSFCAVRYRGEMKLTFFLRHNEWPQ